ncbi:MAG: hypothetical protein PHI45_02915 [Candidatus Pacebacteria bacterium]|nr:hypothetical protein [Candidatus Paceibacterota bacterium]MDD5013130.1 hypothetical protein [Candidatus Paceibacterota bacterium]MDD5753005.1 hypothetical protein [Candidatus Paceibacterota bacterium]
MKYQEFEKQINKPFFTRKDILLNDLKVYNHQLSNWVKKGYLQRVKKGFYVFSNKKQSLTPKEISFHLYGPSYISLESALSYYGAIPEIVYSVTCITTKANRKFSNVFGNFIYRNIRPNLFWGYNVLETENSKYLLASKEKALLDFLYLNRVDDNGFEELRINGDFLKSIDKEKIKAYLKEYNSKKLEKLVFYKILC